MKAAAKDRFPIIEGVSSSESPAHLKQVAARYSLSKSLFKGLAQPVFYTVAFFVILASFPCSGIAAEEIVFRFTEVQAGDACKAWIKEKKADPFSVIRSEDDNYALVCLEQGRWTLLKKGVRDGDKQQWDPVERAYLGREAQ